MPVDLNVLAVGLPLVKQQPCGSIAAPRFTPAITSANGKSFITVSVDLFGGPGVVIARRLN